MPRDRLARWSPLSGAVFAVLFVVGSLLSEGAPKEQSPDARILAFYADDGNRLRLQIGFLVVTLAAVVFVWFVGVLWGRLRQVEREPRWLSAIVLVSGGAFIVMLLTGFVAGGMAADTSDNSMFRLDPNTERLLHDVAYTFSFEVALPLVAPLVLASSLLALRSGLLPRWLGRAGVVVAVACIPGFLAVGMGLFLLWVLAVSIRLQRDGGRVETEAR